MNKKSILLITVLCLAFGLSACTATQEDTAAPVVYDSGPQLAEVAIIADGEIVPQKDVILVFETSGILAESLAEEGQLVRKGDLLFRLEAQEQLLVQAAAAQLEQTAAQQALDDLFQYADTEKFLAYQRILDARAAFNQAEEALDDFNEDTYERDLDAAKEDVADARQELQDAKDDLADYADLDPDNYARESREDAVERAEKDLNQAERDREEVKLEYDRLHLDLDAAEANLLAAETEYAKYGTGPDLDQLELAQQRLAVAAAQLDASNAALANLEVTAPFDGTLVQITPEQGDFIRAGQPVGVLADFSAWYVETTDLSELEVVGIQMGDIVSVTVDAYPGEILSGVVTQIRDYAEIIHSDVTYPARIALDATDLDLRWQMSVIVTFED